MEPLEPTPLAIPPGVIKDATKYRSKGRWTDSALIRFVSGQPQPIGGWAKAFTATMIGTCRSLFAWTDFDGTKFMGIGTNKKWYVESNDVLTDITPIRDTNTLGANPIATTNGSGIVTVTDAAHGAVAGDYIVMSGATAFNNLTTGQLNKEQLILTVPTANTYTFDTGGTANASSSGGGAGVQVEYLLASGTDSVVVTSGGWSAGGWGHAGGWGSAYTASFGNPPMGHWSQGNFGEYLVGATRGGNAVYYWDPNVSASRAADVASIVGSAEAPTKCSLALVDGDAKYCLAFAVNVQGEATANQLHYRWCSQGDLGNWDETDLTGTAGGNDLTHGTTFMTAGVVGSEILIFTDTAVFAITYLGPPLIYDQRTKAIGHQIYSYRAFCASKTMGYWWSKRGFMSYNGVINEMDCPVKEWVFKDANDNYSEKAYAYFDPVYNEAWWFYQNHEGTDVNRYVKFNIADQVWDVGPLARTAMLPQTVYPYPRGTDTAGIIYNHELGIDDTSTGVAVCLGSYVEVADMDTNNGQKAQFIKSLWSDVDFSGSTASAPELRVDLTFKNRPGNDSHSSYSGVIVGAGDAYTDKFDVGKRGRSMSLKLTTNKAGTFWSSGMFRVLLRAVGGR